MVSLSMGWYNVRHSRLTRDTLTQDALTVNQRAFGLVGALVPERLRVDVILRILVTKALVARVDEVDPPQSPVA